MDTWKPATKEQVLQIVEDEAAEDDISQWKYLLVEPYRCDIERFGGLEDAFVVAKTAKRVVYFDDVEEIFGTANEVDGKLEVLHDYGGPLIIALMEAVSES